MIEESVRFLFTTDRNHRSTQTELLSGLAEQPAEFNPWLSEQLRRLVTAHVSEQLQFSGSRFDRRNRWEFRQRWSLLSEEN